DMGAHEFAYDCDDCIRMGDMNYDGLVDGADIQPFVDCALDGDGGAECGCACGDFVGRDGVEVNDVPSFVACLLSMGEGCVTPEPCDYEGEPRAGLLDCNENEVHDEVDIHFCDPSVDPGLCDCNGNGIPDECDIADCDADWTCGDVNANGIPDGCEPDCNGNEIPDDVDIAECDNDPACADCNGNGIPDGCEPDCNENGVPDDCDVDPLDPDGDEWVSPDCNGNGIPDECEPDCNDNGVPDDCDIDPLDPDGDEWISADCNGNGWPDECDIDMGPPFGSMDCNENGIPDECDIANCGQACAEAVDPEVFNCCDCNENGIPDGCDIAAELSEDANENGVPDECEMEMMMMSGGGPGEGGESGEPGCRDAAWAAFHQWCMEQTWGPTSDDSGLEQLRRMMSKRAELGL
ncbi:MAG: hypothetical protein KF841_15115, partial [Phycisphaerae bacterium]|nr:hypothetical protein [Phycisphaerae bacterium]